MSAKWEEFSPFEVAAQFWKDNVGEQTGETFSQNYADLLTAFAHYIAENFEITP